MEGMVPRGDEPLQRLRAMVLYGTRPELIKMAPVVRELRRLPEHFAPILCTTAQHRDMLDPLQEFFALRPDHDLDLMRADQGLNDLAARAFAALDTVLAEERPDLLLVEAGLRTGDLRQPFPEEANRRVVDLVAELCFAPTQRAADSLLAEGVPGARVFVTGNTVVDALQWAASRLPPEPEQAEVLITVHRRESFGAPLRQILAAVRELAAAFPEIRWVYPVHRNPNVLRHAEEILSGIPNVDLLAPLSYLELVRRLRRARLVLTDSGGIQEEAPSFGKRVLVLRDATERPEGVEAGVATVVGTGKQRIVAEATRLLRQAAAGPVKMVNPYGDGQAAARIGAILMRWWGAQRPRALEEAGPRSGRQPQ
jgi:UDP-N-acetylglucosamine 2-epimerase (non-hydrolysing)